MASTLRLTLVRDKPGPWGFRLQGGVDFEKALTVVVTDGTFSFNSGLRTGDVIVNIGALEAGLLTHKQAQDAIISGGNSVDLVIQRFGGAPADPAPGTWRPNVELVGGPATAPAVPGQTYTKTSLVLNSNKPQEEHWDVKYNATAKGFQPGGQSQPRGFSQVSAPSSAGALPDANPSGVGAPLGFRSVAAPITKANGGGASQGPPQPPTCWICQKPVVGVFLQAKGRPLHPECFCCSSCGSSLKNVGHFVIGEKLYCQLHAREAQNQLMGSANPESSNNSGGQPANPPAIAANLAANLSKLSMNRPNAGPAESAPVQAPVSAPQPSPSAPADWKARLESDSAGMAGNAEDFTKEFMKQLTGGL